MASASVIGAVLEKYDLLTFSGRPPIYFDQAPAKTVGGAALVPPYVVLKDDGTAPDYTLDLVPVESTRVRFRVYALTLAAADAIAVGIKWDQGVPTARQGFDFAETLPLTGASLLDHGAVRTREQRSRTADTLSGGPVYLVELSYTIVHRAGTSP